MAKIQMENSNKRIIYADLLRIIATFAVIVLHVSASEWYDTPVKDFNWQIYNLYDSLVRWSVPIFVMLSGMFFLNPEKFIPTSNIIKKYIFRILLAIIVWGLFYQAYEIIGKFIFKNESITFKRIIVAFEKIPFGPPWYHLWYLYMLIGLYLLTPIYRIFVKNAEEKYIRYLLILFFLFGLVLPFLKKVLLHFDSRLNINFEISELINYSGYYFAGYYFSKYPINKNAKIGIYILGFLSFIFTIICTSYISIKNGEPNQYLYGNLLPTTMFEAFTIFLLIKSIDEKEFPEKKAQIISEVSKSSFGIYLIHDFIRSVLFKVGITSDFINPLLAVPVSSVVIFMISLCIIFFTRKIPVSKYIM